MHNLKKAKLTKRTDLIVAVCWETLAKNSLFKKIVQKKKNKINVFQKSIKQPKHLSKKSEKAKTTKGNNGSIALFYITLLIKMQFQLDYIQKLLVILKRKQTALKRLHFLRLFFFPLLAVISYKLHSKRRRKKACFISKGVLNFGMGPFI